jgi:hypothetical protein
MPQAAISSEWPEVRVDFDLTSSGFQLVYGQVCSAKPSAQLAPDT